MNEVIEMKYQITEGPYEKIGVQVIPTRGRKYNIIATFPGEKEDVCEMVLVEKSTEQEERIVLPAEYCLGSLRSVLIHEVDVKKYDYYYAVNGQKVLDEYAKVISGRSKWRDLSRNQKKFEVQNGFFVDHFDWGEDQHPEIPKEDMLIYKLHVRGFSMGNMSCRKKGTFAAILQMIPYFKKLGVTSLELMPVYEFEELELPKVEKVPEYVPLDKHKDDPIVPVKEEILPEKVNYWGYKAGDYFAVKASYAYKSEAAATEYRSLIKALHENGMECIMEMFFPKDVNHNLILDALRFWVRTYHVDGFRLLGENIPITAIVQEPVLSRTKILYHEFPQELQQQKKGMKNLYIDKEEYQYPARKLLNHINGDIREFSNQQRKQGENIGFINYMASNDGFSLADVFMYNDKHNEANLENNFDGTDANFSNNHGVEGPTKKKYILQLRKQKWTNAMIMLMMAQAVPMIWQGDEFSNSNQGNNNTYCQDNEIGWVDWKLYKKNIQDVEFLEKLVAFRKKYSILRQAVPYKFSDYKSIGMPDVSYHGETAWSLDINYGQMNLGIMYEGEYSQDDCKDSIYIAYNFYSSSSALALPTLGKKKKWYLHMDSSQKERFLEKDLLVESNTILVAPQSICILIGR